MAKNNQKSIYSTAKFKFLLVATLATIITYGLKSIALDYSQKVLGDSTVNPERTQEMMHEQAQNDTSPDLNVHNLGTVNFETEHHQQVRLETNHSSIEISTEDGHLRIKAKHKDGTEVNLGEDSLDKINESLGEEDFHIATTSGNGFLLRKGNFEAKTHFPLSINPDTNELTVTTPNGIKTVAVLPDAAVENLIRQKYINIVASSSADSGITLDEYASRSAFLINGISHKKLFGLFPIDVEKQAFVSAENGEVLKINQGFLSKLLSFFSTD